MISNYYLLAIGVLLAIVSVYLLARWYWKWENRVVPKLVFLHSKYKTNRMQPVSSLTLTSLAPVTLTLAVIDENNNNQVIPGTLSNIKPVVGDPAQDSAVADSGGASEVAFGAITRTGGTTVNTTADFVSEEKDANGSPIVSGNFPCTLTIVNNVVVKAALTFMQ